MPELLADPLMKLIYGASYSGAIIAFQILIWSVFLWGANNIYARGLLGCDKQNSFFIILVIQAVSNIALNFALIPSFGLIG
ncbi:polysaccharide biosynthesis C-terminal domain-containing protein [Chloroflexota bacterium]